MDIEYNSIEDHQQEEFQIIDSNGQQNQQQCFFDHVVSMMQQIVISQDFEKKIQLFMKQNWQSLQQCNPTKQQQTFTKFSTIFTSYLSDKISTQMPNFQMSHFFQLLKDRKNQVDDQLLDTLQSLWDINCFNSFMKDCKTSHDQVQTYKVLTIKSNKIPQNKAVKGKDNIFGGAMSNPLFDMKMKKPAKTTSKQQKIVEKTQDQLLVPDLVLTVKGIRKE